jgi:hypothetical protein
MIGQTLVHLEAMMAMAQVTKDDCLSIDDAAALLDTSRATLYNYMNMVNAQRYRFRLDRKTYISKVDIERIRSLMPGKQEEGSK